MKSKINHRKSIVNFVKRIFAKKQKISSVSEKIAEMFLDQDSENLDIGKEEQEILRNAVNFTDTIVEEVMIQRSDIIAVSLEISFAELKELFIKTKHTRILVYQDNLDTAKGFVHIKDMLAYIAHPEDFQMTKILRKLLFIPPAMKIVDLVLQMRDTKIRLALVVDEYGGTDGIITMEDLMNEIVGDENKNQIIQIEQKKFEVDARISIEDLQDRLGIELLDKHNPDYNFETLAGMIVSIANHIPAIGEIIEHESGVRFHTLEAEARYIKKVIVELP